MWRQVPRGKNINIYMNALLIIVIETMFIISNKKIIMKSIFMFIYAFPGLKSI